MVGFAAASAAVMACSAACAAGTLGYLSFAEWRRGVRLKRLRSELDGLDGADGGAFASEGLAAHVLGYAVGLERRITLGAVRACAPAWIGGEERRLYDAVRRVGLQGSLSRAGCAEARLRLALLGLACGAVVGAVFSMELSALLGVLAACIGFFAVPWALREEARARVAALERELPEMLEVVSLGLRSGLSFDKSLSLYCSHFQTPFSRACAAAQRQWGLGLRLRDEALRDLAASYDSPLLSRVVEAMVRSLRFGSSLAQDLEAAAVEARAVHRARREEDVAKAPVKMMIPTGALILPAMLMLVLGPILLELMEGF